MTVIEMIRLIAPEFADVTDAVLEQWVEFMKPFVSKKLFGELYERAIAYLVCHKLKMTGYGENALGALGSISNGFSASSVSDGGSSISFASAGQSNLANDAEFALTIYGTQFIDMRKKVLVPIRISGE